MTWQNGLVFSRKTQPQPRGASSDTTNPRQWVLGYQKLVTKSVDRDWAGEGLPRHPLSFPILPQGGKGWVKSLLGVLGSRETAVSQRMRIGIDSPIWGRKTLPRDIKLGAHIYCMSPGSKGSRDMWS